MIELSQDQIVNLFIEKMKMMGPSKSGVYNDADPTHYEKGHAKIGMGYGFTETQDEDEPIMCGYPMPENVLVHWHDVTWGVEFEITTSVGVEKAYWSRPMFGSPGSWARLTENFFKVFKRVLLEGQDQDFWIAEESLGAMGYYER